MITEELKSRIDSVWNDFWSAGISHPLEVIEQVTYRMSIQGIYEPVKCMQETGVAIPHIQSYTGTLVTTAGEPAL